MYRDTFSFLVGVEASATWHPGLSQWRPLFVDSQGQVVRSQNRTKCVKYVWLSYPTWPSRWVLCISMQSLRLKGCHVACDEWMSGEICSLQHMWVTGSVMWAATSDESLKFGSKVQARLTDFRELTAREITGFDCICIHSRYIIACGRLISPDVLSIVCNQSQNTICYFQI